MYRAGLTMTKQLLFAENLRPLCVSLIQGSIKEIKASAVGFFTCEYNQKVDIKVKTVSLLQGAQHIQAGGVQQMWCRRILTSSHPAKSQMASEEEACPPETSSNSMASSLINSPLNPVCVDILTHHLTPLSLTLFCTYLSVFPRHGAISAFYFGWWPDQLNQIYFTFDLLAAPLNFQPNWACRSIPG